MGRPNGAALKRHSQRPGEATPEPPAPTRAEVRELIAEALRMVAAGEVLHASDVDVALSLVDFIAWHGLRAFEGDLCPALRDPLPPPPTAKRIDELTDTIMRHLGNESKTRR